MFWEASYLWVSKREIPFYYFKYQYRKSVTNFKDYLSTKEGMKIQKDNLLHKDELISIMANKLSFSLYCKKNELPIAKMVSYNLDSNFFFDGEVFKVKNSEDLFTFFNHVFDKTKLQSTFIKPLAQYGGAGCFKINKNKNILISTDYLKKNLYTSQIIDSRKNSKFYDKSGYIINANNYYFKDNFFNDSTLNYKKIEQSLISRYNLKKDTELIIYDDSVFNASVTWYILYKNYGFNNIKVYKDNFSEWIYKKLPLTLPK